MAKRKAVSIRDVARESNASLTTVSLVLNRRDARISEETRARVLETVNRLGYRPSRLAQGLQSQKAGILAVVVPQLRHAFADVYFGEILSAIQETAAENGYKVLLEVANETYVAQKQHVELFHRHYIDGMLNVGITNRDTYVNDLVEGAFPAVVVNNYLPGHELNHVTCDYHQAGRLAGNYLTQFKHRNVALIHGAREVQTTADLETGFVEALQEAGHALDPRRTEDGLYTEEGGEAAALKLIERDPSITAIMAGNDKMAIGAISGLKKAGLRVPVDVSVVGCDNMHQAEYCDPPLTTIHTPLFDVGCRACDRLLALIDGQIDAVKETHPVSLTVRNSCAPPRNSR